MNQALLDPLKDQSCWQAEDQRGLVKCEHANPPTLCAQRRDASSPTSHDGYLMDLKRCLGPLSDPSSFRHSHPHWSVAGLINDRSSAPTRSFYPPIVIATHFTPTYNWRPHIWVLGAQKMR